VPPTDWDHLFHVANKVLPSSLRVRTGGDKLHKLAIALDAGSPLELYRSFVSQWQQPHEVLLDGAESPFVESPAPPPPTSLGYIERMMYMDTITYLPCDILCKVDRATMSTGLESRVPFLDPAVAAFAWDLPLEAKIHASVGKWPLRQLLRRYVPVELFERPKTGFGIPIGEWIRGPMRDWAEDLLSTKALVSTGVFRPSVVEACWRDHLSRRRNNQHTLWGVLMFQCWYRRWIRN
jgi:asparagine synthase (glutamine-hydrolysing)